MTERGRVPFGVLGVLVLILSSTVVVSLGQPEPAEPEVDSAMDRLTAETRTALQEAGREAAAAAAREPIVEPAETPYGAVLNESGTFRDALRIRIYLAARSNLARLDNERGGLRVSAGLPATRSPAALEAAKNRVRLEPLQNGTGFEVRIDGVELEATRDGQPVAQETISPTFVVRTPVLAVHNRVEDFEQRLNAGPGKPGLARELTKRLYALAWARGYAQYAGVPIQNVVAMRHVELFTNGAVLTQQQRAFGHRDPTGTRVHERAIAQTGITDILVGSGLDSLDTLQKIRSAPGYPDTPADTLERLEPDPGTPSAGDFVRPGVNETARRGLLETLTDLDAILNRTYTVEARLRTSVEGSRTRTVQAAEPVPTWTPIDRSKRTRTTVRTRNGSQPQNVDGRVFAHFPRTVEQTETITERWRTPAGETRTTRRIERTTTDVTVTVVGDPGVGHAPDRPITGVFDPGGPFDGENLADVPRKALQRLLVPAGGPDALAKETVTDGRPVSRSVTVTGSRPAGLEEWIYEDLSSLHRRVRNVSITATRGQVASLETNVPGQLETKLLRLRDELVDAPARYDSVAHRARVAARAAYLEAVLAELSAGARRHVTTRKRVTSQIGGGAGGAGSPLTRGYADSQAPAPNGTEHVVAGWDMRVASSPSYLTLEGIKGSRFAGVPDGVTEHPIVARKHNYFSVPYGEATNKVLESVGKRTSQRVGLDRAARTLRVLESRTDEDELGTPHRKLRGEIRTTNEVARGLYAARLADAVGPADRATSEAVIESALAAWNESLASRALALTNGTFIPTAVAAARERWPGALATPHERELLTLRLEAARRDLLDRPGTKVSRSLAGGASATIPRELEARLAGKLSSSIQNATESAIAEALDRERARIPAGLPVTPIPGFWYATINVWEVEVAGEYPRFVVRVPRGTPDAPGADMPYVRDGSAVTLDVTGNGSAEYLGNASRIGFDVGALVTVGVPPDPLGVGDVDGEPLETSPGWPLPGPVGRQKDGSPAPPGWWTGEPTPADQSE